MVKTMVYMVMWLIYGYNYGYMVNICLSPVIWLHG